MRKAYKYIFYIILTAILLYTGAVPVLANSHMGPTFPGYVSDGTDTPGYDYHTNKAYTDPAQAFWAYIDETTGDVCIDTRDKVHTSTILYRTGGFSMSRCAFNPAEMELSNGINSDDIIYVAQSGALPSMHAYVTESGTPYEYSSFRFPFDELCSYIQQAGSTQINGLQWSDEINKARNGEAGIYFRFDGFLYISHDEGANFYVYPYKNEPEDGPYGYNQKNLNLNPAEIKAAEGWGAATLTSLDFHYNVYLYFGPESPDDDPPPDVDYDNHDHHITYTSIGVGGTPEGDDSGIIDLIGSGEYAGDKTADPTYAGGNANNQGYDAALGVPTTKSITGYSETVPWYGNFDVWVRMVSHIYQPIYIYQWEVSVPDVSGSSLPSAMSYWDSYGLPEYLDPEGRDTVTATISGSAKHDDTSNPAAVTGYSGVTVTFKVIRKFKDIVDGENYGNVKTYVAFQYIDPRTTNFYDFSNLQLENSAYAGPLTFPKTCNTDLYIARRKNLADDILRTAGGEGSEINEADPSTLIPETSDYVEWASESGANVNPHPAEFEPYDEGFKSVQEYLYTHTKTCNDTVRVRWEDPTTGYTDNGAKGDWANSEGYYLGNKGASGVVKGCNFRYCYYTDEYGDQLGDVETNIGPESGEAMSDKWELCTESAGGTGHSKGGSNAGNTAHPCECDLTNKFSGSNETWEILVPQTGIIAANKANGQYRTTISDVTYSFIGPEVEGFKKAQKRTFPGVQAATGNLYCNDYADHGNHGEIISEQSSEVLSYQNGAFNSDSPQSIYVPVTGIAAGHYICDPINVHTPVISPTVVTDGDGNHLEHSETIGRTQLVIENGGYDTRVLDDTRDSAELRLDEFYVVHWQDLVEYSSYLSNPHESHRDIDTPPDDTVLDDGSMGGGYRDETASEDQFVRNKYMKFPFEVWYDNRFYAANTWIELNNPNTADGIPFEADGVGWGYEAGHGWDRPSDVAVNPDNARITSENHWKDTPIYIPSWSKEGLYNTITGRGGSHTTLSAFESNTCMQFMVRAINTSASGDGYEKLQDLANTTYNFSIIPDDGGQYVACWSMPVELSGWLYDFTITGTSDADQFAAIDDSIPDRHQINLDQNYSFTKHWQDKKPGLLNRIAQAVVRFAKDGSIGKYLGITGWDPQNTVTLTGSYDNTTGHYLGKSNVYEDMGNLSRGTSFTYSVKTMSNMWDFLGDTAGATIHIVPTFSWARYEGTGWNERTHDELQVYYSDEKGNFIPYGTGNDTSNIKRVCLGNHQFDDSYYRDDDISADPSHAANMERYGQWIEYTAYQHNFRNGLFLLPFDNYLAALGAGTLTSAQVSVLQWKNAKNPEYCLSDIRLPQKMRLLTGEADQLKQNIFNTGEEVHAVNPGDDFTTYWTMTDDGTNFDRIFRGSFSGSGSYDRDDEPMEDYFLSEYGEHEKGMDYATRDSMQTWYGGYYVPSALYVMDLRGFSWTDLDGVTWTGAEVKADPQGFIRKYAYYDRAHGDGLQGDEDIFLQSGYLKINFDIKAWKDWYDSSHDPVTEHEDYYNHRDGIAEPYLKYEGTNGGMWRTQGYTPTDGWDPGSPDPPTPNPDPPKAPPTDPGDVVVIDIGKRWSERYKAGIFNIN